MVPGQTHKLLILCKNFGSVLCVVVSCSPQSMMSHLRDTYIYILCEASEFCAWAVIKKLIKSLGFGQITRLQLNCEGVVAGCDSVNHLLLLLHLSGWCV